jgi:peptidoglycan-associated lipoprotein
MRLKILSLLAAVTMISACAQDQDIAGGSSGSGSTSTNQSSSASGSASSGVSYGTVPGSRENFVSEVGDRVFFDYDKSDLTADSQATLDRQATWLQKFPSVRVSVEGHCDERGTREYNLALGERRASAVKDYLVARGIDGGRISTISYGKEKPVALGSDKSAWSQNRRGVTEVN